MLTATAFGGTNGAVIVRRAEQQAPPAERADKSDIIIAGMGAVSPLGGTLENLLAGLVQPHVPLARVALRVDDAWLRKSRAG